MAQRIEDYALIGDTRTAALVGRDGSIDWLCLPRFDSGACFAALLGDERHGRWRLAPAGDVVRVERRYRPGTLVLETDFETADGAVRITDCMPLSEGATEVARVVEGLRGTVAMSMELIVRFDYGRVVPWVRRLGGALSAVAGPDAVLFAAPVPTRGENMTTRADFDISAGDSLPFLMTWHPSEQRPPGPIDARAAVADTAEAGGGPLAAAREKASELLGRRPEGGLLLLRDLRRLHLLYAEASIDWVVLAQGAQAIRDGELVETVARCHAETLRGMKWTVTRLKTAAPQVLAG